MTTFSCSHPIFSFIYNKAIELYRGDIEVKIGTGIMIAVLLIASLLGAVALNASNPVVVQGYVYDQNRQPVPGVSVKICDSQNSAVYGEGVTNSQGYFAVQLNDSAVGRHVDIYWTKWSYSREEFGLLIPYRGYKSRLLYTYMTLPNDSAELVVYVYDYPSGDGVSNLTVSVENAQTTEIIATGVTDANGIARIRVPSGVELNAYANLNSTRPDVLGGQELGIHPWSGTVPATIYVEKLL